MSVGPYPLHELATQEGSEQFYEVLNAAEELDLADPEGNTPLHLAVFMQCPSNVQALVARGANVNSINKKQWTPLHCACVNNNMDLATFLLDNGAEPDFETDDGWKALELIEDQGAREFLINRANVLKDTRSTERKELSNTTNTSSSIKSYENLLQAVKTRVHGPADSKSYTDTTTTSYSNKDQGLDSTLVDSLVEDIEGRSSERMEPGHGVSAKSRSSGQESRRTSSNSHAASKVATSATNSTSGRSFSRRSMSRSSNRRVGSGPTGKKRDSHMSGSPRSGLGTASYDVNSRDKMVEENQQKEREKATTDSSWLGEQTPGNDDQFERNVQDRVRDAMAPVLQSPIGLTRARRAFYDEAGRNGNVEVDAAAPLSTRERRQDVAASDFEDVPVESDGPSEEDEIPGDPDLVRMANEFDKWSVLLKRSLLNDFLDCKKGLLARHKGALVKEYKRHKAESARQKEEVENMHEFVRNFEKTVAQKDEEIALLKEQISVMTMEAREQRLVGQQQVEAGDYDHESKQMKWAHRYRTEKLTRAVLLEWRGAVKRARWKSIDKIAQERVDEATAILTDEYNESMRMMKDELEAAIEDARAARAERDHFQDQMKKSFMRGVCALNLEALGMFKQAGSAVPPDFAEVMAAAEMASEESILPSEGEQYETNTDNGVSWAKPIDDSELHRQRSKQLSRRALRETNGNRRPVEHSSKKKAVMSGERSRQREVIKTTTSLANDSWTTQSSAARPKKVKVERHKGGPRRIEIMAAGKTNVQHVE